MRTLYLFISIISFLVVIVLFIAFSDRLNISANFLVYYIYFSLLSFFIFAIFKNKLPTFVKDDWYATRGSLLKTKALFALFFPTIALIYFLINTLFDSKGFLLALIIGPLLGFIGYKASLKDFTLRNK